MTPYSREDAARRARFAENEAEHWRTELRERERFAEEATTDADRVAALGCAHVARSRVARALEDADLYRRIARGEPLA